MWKWIIGTVVFLLVVVGGGAAVVAPKLIKAGGDSDKGGIEVQIEPVVRGTLVQTVSAPGAIEPHTKVEISAQVSARIVALPFREGEDVKAGDVVVRLDARDLAAALASAQAGLKSNEAALDGAKAAFIRAQAEFDRVKELYDTHDVSKSELDMTEADFLQARSRLGQAEQAIEIAKANIEQREKDLDNAIITSPIDGTITRLNAEIGETVVVGTLNNPGSVIMEVADLSRMLLKAQVDEINIAEVVPGQRAIIYINAYPDREYTGTVQRVSLKRQIGADGVGYFETEILVDLSEGETLYSGLTANTDIEVETMHDALVVPSQAVVDRRVDELPKDIRENDPLVDRDKTFARIVYVVGEDRKTVATPVSAGPSDQRHTVILAGIDEGERVVVGPFKVLTTLENGQLTRDIEAEKDQAETDQGEGAKGEGADGSADADKGTEADKGAGQEGDGAGSTEDDAAESEPGESGDG